MPLSRRRENSLVTLKVGGRFRELPIWATKLSFEVRPSADFDRRAWKLWKPTLLLMNRVCKREKINVSWVRIHSHFRLRRELPHAMGWWDPIERSAFLCHFDKETMLHELGHAKSSGYHGDPWARATWKLYRKYLTGRERDRAFAAICQYLSGRRVYRNIFKSKSPKYEHPKSIWWGLRP